MGLFFPVPSKNTAAAGKGFPSPDYLIYKFGFGMFQEGNNCFIPAVVGHRDESVLDGQCERVFVTTNVRRSLHLESFG